MAGMVSLPAKEVRKMEKARITSKGQVTVPKAVREALDLKRGDYLVFELPEGEVSSVRVAKGARLTDLYGVLPATRRSPGKEAVREEVGRELGRKRSESGRT